jgi:acetate kinase
MARVKKVLILNSGSSSLKWSFLDARDESTIQEGREDQTDSGLSIPETLRALLGRFPNPDAVGQRVVHGGTLFQKTIRINADSRKKLESLVELDPLHMKPALAWVDAVTAALPLTPQFASFDTAFHATLPETTGYALPREWTKKWGLRRFGFHGLSVAYAVRRAGEMLGSLPDRLIVCHLGSGSSVTAVEKGKSLDTTMGFTPLEGLVMATRSGSVDPGLLLYLQLHCDVKPEQLEKVLSHESGLLGVSGISGDLREVVKAMDDGSASAALAYGQFIRSARRAVGAMAAVLGGVDALVFTGGIGENQPRVRQDITSTLVFTGVQLDAQKNHSTNSDGDVSGKNSKARILVIKAREDLTILRELLQDHKI